MILFKSDVLGFPFLEKHGKHTNVIYRENMKDKKCEFLYKCDRIYLFWLQLKLCDTCFEHSEKIEEKIEKQI